MKYKFIKKFSFEFPAEKMCLVLKASRSGYYKWLNHKPRKREQENKILLDKIKDIDKDHNGLYGSRRIHIELKEFNLFYNLKRIIRLMKSNNIYAKTKKKFKITTNSAHSEPISANLLKRNFVTYAPDMVWVGDITYVWTMEGWMYLSTVIDLFSRKVVGWAMRDNMSTDLIIESFLNAASKRKINMGLIFHSDRGSQYASKDFKKILNLYQVKQSMSGKGNCYDNAVAESFFHTYKTEEVYFNSYKTKEFALLKTFEYIEAYYNRKRRHSFLGYLSPDNFENQVAGKAA